MISISTPTYNLDGNVIFKEDNATRFPISARRVTKTATLDGDSTLNDMGYSITDGEFIIKTTDQEAINKVEDILKNYPLVLLSSKMGLFEGAVTNLDKHNYPASFVFLIKREL